MAPVGSDFPDVQAVRIESPVGFFPEVMEEDYYIYFIKDGDRVALIDTGHRESRTQVVEALRTFDVKPERVERIVVTSWDPRHLGNVDLFPNAQLFTLSPDFIKPFNYRAVFDTHRYRLQKLVQELHEVREKGESGIDFVMLSESCEKDEMMVDRFFDCYYDVPEPLFFTPLADKQVINLCGVDFHVLDHSSFYRGQLALFEPNSSTLFGYAVPTLGLPKPFYSFAAVIPMIDRLAALNPKVIGTTNSGFEEGMRLLKRGRSFAKNFLENAPAALRKRPTLLEFVQQNFGYTHEHLIDYLFELVKYQDVLNELARDEDIAIEGSGIDGRRYGMNVLDTRHPRLQY